MADVFQEIVGVVHGHALAVDPSLIELWVRDTWREITRYCTWSFLRRQYQIVLPAPYATGTVALSPSSSTATFTGATLTQAHVGRQFRVGTNPLHEIVSVDPTAGTAELFPDPAYLTAAVTGQSYKIFTAYLTPPADFFAWLNVRDIEHRHRIRLTTQLAEVDYHDPRRTLGNRPAALLGYDWARASAGRVFPVLQVVGSGPEPVASGTYTGQSDSLYVLTIATGGAVDTATFTWSRDGGTPTTLTCSSAGNSLSLGVGVEWPTGTYVLGDVFIVRVSSYSYPTLPRYELYPHHTAAQVLQALYAVWPGEIDEPGFVLPRPLTADVVELGALARMARFSGTDNKPNPSAQIARAQALETKFTDTLQSLSVSDQYIMQTWVDDNLEQWDEWGLPWAPGGLLRRNQTDDWLVPYIP